MISALEFVNYDFGQKAILAAFLIGLISGSLSPLVVLRGRSFLGETISHLVFPGVVVGYLVSLSSGVPLWFSLVIASSVTALLGSHFTQVFVKRLSLPADAAGVATLSGFFACGVILVTKFKGTTINLEHVLLGDALALDWQDIGVLAAVSLIVLSAIGLLRRHWSAWISDEEFAAIAGYRVSLMSKLFPILLTASVLVGLFTVGSLMISALLVLPCVLCTPRAAFDVRVILVSVFLCLFGTIASFQFDLPVGASIVLTGFVIAGIKAAFKPT